MIRNTAHVATPRALTGFTRLRGLVREATLAPSSHNTQPWKFRLGDRSIAMLPDLTRRCPVVDPDDHHLYVSLGCATENIVWGAGANGLYAHVDSRADRDRCRLRGNAALESALYDALPASPVHAGRSTTARPMSRTRYRAPRVCAARGPWRARHRPDQARSEIETVLEYVTRGNGRTRFATVHSFDELATWIRFNEADAVRSRRRTLHRRRPAIPRRRRWLGRLLLAEVLLPARRRMPRCVRSARCGHDVTGASR